MDLPLSHEMRVNSSRLFSQNVNQQLTFVRKSLISNVDQPGLIHGISLSLLAKYLPFVLIVCVAEM